MERCHSSIVGVLKPRQQTLFEPVARQINFKSMGLLGERKAEQATDGSFPSKTPGRWRVARHSVESESPLYNTQRKGDGR